MNGVFSPQFQHRGAALCCCVVLAKNVQGKHFLLREGVSYSWSLYSILRSGSSRGLAIRHWRNGNHRWNENEGTKSYYSSRNSLEYVLAVQTATSCMQTHPHSAVAQRGWSRLNVQDSRKDIRINISKLRKCILIKNELFCKIKIRLNNNISSNYVLWV